jgi:glucose/mannose-6-phosphate isomerase
MKVPLEAKQKKLDSSGMVERIREFPVQIRQGWEMGDSLQGLFPESFQTVILSGMGGSATAGDLIQYVMAQQLPFSFIVNREYHLPGYANENTFFIASSYSGDTEEVLSCLQQAEENGCSIICITSGGALADIAVRKTHPLYTLPKGYPPRAALGYSLGVLLYLFHDYTNSIQNQVDQAIEHLESCRAKWGDINDQDNEAVLIAMAIYGRIPLIYSVNEGMGSIGYRWKTQINENSQSHAFFHSLPEMNHNEIMGWEPIPGGSWWFTQLIPILLRLSNEKPRIHLRMEITKKLIQQAGIDVLEITARGADQLSQILHLIYLGDWVSYYLALLYGVDPTSISNIEKFKTEMRTSNNELISSSSDNS